MGLTGRQFLIRAADAEATVVEVGAGLRRFAVGGVDVSATYPDGVLAPKCCGGVLVPWPNRLRGGRYRFGGEQFQLALTEPAAGNAIHGLGRWERWEVVGHEPSRVTLGLDVVPQSGWPFEVRVEVTYALGADGLGVTLAATNTGERPAPFGAGCHPYLSTRGAALADVVLTVPAERHVVVDAAQIPVRTEPVAGGDFDFRAGRVLGGQRLDDGFTALTGREARVDGPHGGARLWFDDSVRYLQAFTVEDLAGGGPAVALEPMTCAADAFNSGDGLVVLEPAQSFAFAWGIAPA
ncbi:MAG: aldose epimerase [Jatrophihabitans sp.]|nr:MAG: aldose epimerase [Jatrophihabitans sp.]